MGRWAAYRRRGRAVSFFGLPRVALATIDPGVFGQTDGVLKLTFNRRLTTNNARGLQAKLLGEGAFQFDQVGTFTPGDFTAVWVSTNFFPGLQTADVVSWGGIGGPIVFEDGSTLTTFVDVPLTRVL